MQVQSIQGHHGGGINSTNQRPGVAPPPAQYPVPEAQTKRNPWPYAYHYPPVLGWGWLIRRQPWNLRSLRRWHPNSIGSHGWEGTHCIIRSQEPGPSLSPAPMIIVAFFSSGLLWMANPKMALGSKAVVAEVSSRPSRWGRRWSSSKNCFDRLRRLVIQLRARRLVVALKVLFEEGKEVP